MIFLDTGPIRGRWVGNDPMHQEAIAAWTRLDKQPDPVVTTTHVIHEVMATFVENARKHKNPALARYGMSRMSELLGWGRLRFVRPDERIELEALNLCEKYAYKPVSFGDCISFVVMRSLGITRVFSFDRRDFRDTAGFVIWNDE